MNISVVICTRNRAAQLAVALNYWLKIQSNLSWEMIIVDNGSTDETLQVIEAFRAKFSQRLVYIYESLPGLGRGRNRGWRATQGSIIIFTDDDCYPDLDYLNANWQCFAENEKLGYVGGRVLLFDPTDYPITIQVSLQRVDFRPFSFLKAGKIQGANFACRRRALEDVKGFDNRLGAGTPFPCEDVDLIARMSAEGWWGAYDPRPLVYHHHRRKTKQEADQLQIQYAWGRGAYYAKCLANPKIRWVYAFHWMLQMLRQKPRVTLLEWRSFFEFLSTRMRTPANEDLMERISVE